MRKEPGYRVSAANRLESMASRSSSSSSGAACADDFAEYIAPLVRFAREHYGETDGIGKRFCQEVIRVTDGRARMILRHQAEERARWSEASVTEASVTCVTVSVGYNSIRYGELYVRRDPLHPQYPSLSMETCIELAHTCGWLFHALREGALVQLQCRNLANPRVGDLSRRQVQILSLMAQGYKREAIAECLGISAATVDSHRRTIYCRLGVHSEMAAVFAAHKAGMLLQLDMPGSPL